MILHIYTKDYGKIEAVARSARKEKGKLKGHLELFLLAELILARGRNIDTITSSLTVESFSRLRNNLELSFGAYYILELADKMTIEGHRDERIFYLLKSVLGFLDDIAGTIETRQCLVSTNSIKLTKSGRDETISRFYYLSILLFQIHLLNLSGFSPELNKCVICSKHITSGGNYFSFNLGGVVDKNCKRKLSSAISISDNAIKLIRLFQFKNSGGLEDYARCLDRCFETVNKLKVDDKTILESIFLMNRFVEFNVERKVRAVDFIYKLG